MIRDGSSVFRDPIYRFLPETMTCDKQRPYLGLQRGPFLFCFFSATFGPNVDRDFLKTAISLSQRQNKNGPFEGLHFYIKIGLLVLSPCVPLFSFTFLSRFWLTRIVEPAAWERVLRPADAHRHHLGIRVFEYPYPKGLGISGRA